MTNTITPEELIISMMTNEPMTEQAVRRALAGRGPIESVKPTGPSAGLGQASTAWLVEFVYYADCRDTIKVNSLNRFSCFIFTDGYAVHAGG